ncbi:shikimate dehydrogenase [Pseudopelagicola sp. nBUS_19]|uniref:shikimate dehydrogenase n=1 Tax=Pseudopelagicola sp. nBUS_19 TaxID=3395316 RepID=UPI003EBC1468
MTLPSIPLSGVIGDPIAHSKSPKLHGYWLRKYGLNGQYVPLEVETDDLANVLKAMPRMGFVGCNVTLPHKERALHCVDQITDRATLIGAVNTIIFRNDGTSLGDNTDGYGFIENLRQGAPNWLADTGPAVVLGAGGAARAVIASLLDAGVAEIFLTNRTRARSEQLREDFGARVIIVDWIQAGNVLEKAATLVNTTSLGMIGKPELRVPLDGLQKNTVVTDLVYTPIQTPLLAKASSKGCTTVDGLGMLLHQAVPGFERWFGRRPVVDDETRQAIQ